MFPHSNTKLFFFFITLSNNEDTSTRQNFLLKHLNVPPEKKVHNFIKIAEIFTEYLLAKVKRNKKLSFL